MFTVVSLRNIKEEIMRSCLYGIIKMYNCYMRVEMI